MKSCIRKHTAKFIVGCCAGVGILLTTQCSQPTPERVIVKPQIAATNNQVLEIDSIVRTDSSTVFHMQAFYRPKYWIRIDSKSFLTDNFGQTYPIQKGVGIDLGQKCWMPASGQTAFQLVFPALPPQATSVDFSEGEEKDAYGLWGIQLSSQKRLQIELPNGVKEARMDPNESLPDPCYQYGMATLKGKILHHQPGMATEGTLRVIGMLQNDRAEKSIAIADDGRFEVQIPAVAPVNGFVYLPYGRFECMLAPNETTEIYINPAECARQKSKLRKDDPAIGKRVYYAGYLAGLQQEMADHEPLNATFASDYEEYLKNMNLIAGMTAEEFQTFLLRQMDQKKLWIENSSFSRANKELALIKLCQSTASAMARAEGMLKEAHILKHQLNSEESRTYFKHTRIDLPKSYFDCWKEMPLLFSPRACYANTLCDWVNSVSFLPQLPDVVAENREMVHLLQAERLMRGIRNFQPLSEKQRAEVKTLPECYQLLIEAAHQQLMEKVEANKRKVGAQIHEIEKVKNEDLFPALLSKFRGHTLLIDFWATWCGPCQIGHKEMAPLKKEWKEKDIVYIYIAGENSPEGAWKNMISDIPGEHFRITQSQWNYLSQELGVNGVPTYLFVDKNGTIVHKIGGFPGVDEIKKQLQKAMGN